MMMVMVAAADRSCRPKCCQQWAAQRPIGTFAGDHQSLPLLLKHGNKKKQINADKGVQWAIDTIRYNNNITYHKSVPVDGGDPNRVPTTRPLQGPDDADMALTARGGIAAQAEQAHGSPLLMMVSLLLLASVRRRNIPRHGGSHAGVIALFDQGRAGFQTRYEWLTDESSWRPQHSPSVQWRIVHAYIMT
jgi:hypothetical protein